MSFAKSCNLTQSLIQQQYTPVPSNFVPFIFRQNCLDDKVHKITIKAHEYTLNHLTIDEDGVLSTGDGVIKKWDRLLTQCLWSYFPEKNILWHKIWKTFEHNFICFGSYQELNLHQTIHILDFQGKLRSILDYKILNKQVCVTARSIFALMTNGNVLQWDHLGKFITYHPTMQPSPFSTSFLAASEEHICHLFDKTLYHLNLKKTEIPSIHHTTLCLASYLSTMTVDQNHLHLTYFTLPKNTTDQFYCFDLNKGVFQSLTFLNFTECIKRALQWKNWNIYGTLQGSIFKFNQTTYDFHLLGYHEGEITLFCHDQDILVSGHYLYPAYHTQLKIWDLKQNSLLKILNFSFYLTNLHIHQGQIYYSYHSKLICLDYLTSSIRDEKPIANNAKPRQCSRLVQYTPDG